MESLVVRVIQPDTQRRQYEKLSECGIRVAGVLQSRDLALLLLRDVPLVPEPSFGPICPPPRPAEAVDPGDCVLATTADAGMNKHAL
jgi:hypothetical protein